MFLASINKFFIAANRLADQKVSNIPIIKVTQKYQTNVNLLYDGSHAEYDIVS